VDRHIDECIGQDGVNKALNLPRNFATKLKSASAILDDSFSKINEIEEKINLIQTASEAATNLPVTLHDIEDAKQKLDSARVFTAGREVEIGKLLEKASSNLNELLAKAEHAESVAARIDGSYRAITSQGLAQAFHQKEKSLKRSTYVWVFFLFLSLCLMAAVGYFRFPQIQAALVGEPKWGVVVVEIILAALSLGAPAWFAIISTKQISQRFRLAEDYGYKAAISAAYEGYRSEAQRFGEDFQTKLFASALDRLDEQPLRFVDHDSGGSPMHELFNSLAKMIDTKTLKELSEKLPKMIDDWKIGNLKAEKQKSDTTEKAKD
jgi:hypothetical protein